MPPTAFCTLPAILSPLPSLSSLESPSALPAVSLTLPFRFFAEPSMRSSSATVFSFGGCLSGNVRRSPEFRRRGVDGTAPLPPPEPKEPDPACFRLRGDAARPAARRSRKDVRHG